MSGIPILFGLEDEPVAMTWMRFFKTYLPDKEIHECLKQLTNNAQYVWEQDVQGKKRDLQSNITNIEEHSQYITGKFDFDYVERKPTRNHPEGREIVWLGQGNFIINSEGVVIFFGGERGSERFASHIQQTTKYSLKSLPLSSRFLKKLREDAAVYGVKKICYHGFHEEGIEEFMIKGTQVDQSITSDHLESTGADVRKLTVVLSLNQNLVTMSFFDTGSVCLYGYNGKKARQYALSAVDTLSPILPKVEAPLTSFTSPPFPEKATTVKEK